MAVRSLAVVAGERSCPGNTTRPTARGLSRPSSYSSSSVSPQPGLRPPPKLWTLVSAADGIVAKNRTASRLGEPERSPALCSTCNSSASSSTAD